MMVSIEDVEQMIDETLAENETVEPPIPQSVQALAPNRSARSVMDRRDERLQQVIDFLKLINADSFFIEELERLQEPSGMLANISADNFSQYQIETGDVQVEINLQLLFSTHRGIPAD